MPILAADIKYFKTLNGLGGAITAEEVTSGLLHDVFDLVTGGGAQTGETNYRCIYVQNASATLPLLQAVAYLVTQSPAGTTTVSFGIGSSVVGGTEQSIPDELTSPVGVTFVSLEGVNNGQGIGDIASTSYKAIWLRRVIASGSNALTGDNAIISVQGDTGT